MILQLCAVDTGFICKSFVMILDVILCMEAQIINIPRQAFLQLQQAQCLVPYLTSPLSVFGGLQIANSI